MIFSLICFAHVRHSKWIRLFTYEKSENDEGKSSDDYVYILICKRQTTFRLFELFSHEHEWIITDVMMENFTATHDDIQYKGEILSLNDLRNFLGRVFYPCLLIWGTIGNTLCLRVLLSKKFFKNSTCQYLAILAVIDILFIFMRSSKHVTKSLGANAIYNTSQWICRILTFFSAALAHMASWILVIVSFDRYLVVTNGYRRQSSTVNRVFCSTAILVGVVVLCNLYYFYILGKLLFLTLPLIWHLQTYPKQELIF